MLVTCPDVGHIDPEAGQENPQSLRLLCINHLYNLK